MAFDSGWSLFPQQVTCTWTITGSHFKKGDLMSECLLSTSYSWFARKSFVFDQFAVVPNDG